jgi:hypothetical protein
MNKTRAIVVVAIAAVLVAAGATAVHNLVVFGTISTSGAPPRVDYCGRRYYPSDTPVAMSRAQVDAFLAENGEQGLSRIDTAPSGLPVLANVMTPEERIAHHTTVCTMGVWVQTGPDSYVPYGLSGGP